MEKDVEFKEYESQAIDLAIAQGWLLYEIKVLLKESCKSKSKKAFSIFQLLEESGEIIKAIPKIEDIEAEKFEFQFEIEYIVESTTLKSDLEKKLLSIEEVANAIVNKIDYKSKQK